MNSKKINVILDINLKGPALRGYGDVLEALGYIQGEHVMRDINGDGRIERWEIEENLIRYSPT
ncbi:MAG: hypothetical protein DRO89_06455 [Candidatus Altiarchaeales archaeon]|nr:MAG: hypothetical protein DRO89_06455 [Candidatus Altiarchaeales archaeon]